MFREALAERVVHDEMRSSRSASCGCLGLVASLVGLGSALLVIHMQRTCFSDMKFIATRDSGIEMALRQPPLRYATQSVAHQHWHRDRANHHRPGEQLDCLEEASSQVVPVGSKYGEATRQNSRGSWDHRQMELIAARSSSRLREYSDIARRGMQATYGAVPRKKTRFFEPTSPEVVVQGGSLKTWTYTSPAIQRIHMALRTDGRPLDTDVELWKGPDNTPLKLHVYAEDGERHPFITVLETSSSPSTVAVRNTGHLEFPVSTQVGAVPYNGHFPGPHELPWFIQGGAIKTYPVGSNVDSVEVLLRTDGRPLNARIELLQGPNTNKQVIELYTEDGMDRPFYGVLKTPGHGYVVRIVNTGPVELPMTASVAAFTTSTTIFFNDVQSIVPTIG